MPQPRFWGALQTWLLAYHGRSTANRFSGLKEEAIYCRRARNPSKISVYFCTVRRNFEGGDDEFNEKFSRSPDDCGAVCFCECRPTSFGHHCRACKKVQRDGVQRTSSGTCRQQAGGRKSP